MVGGDVNLYPLFLLMNYWEITPSQLSSRLDELLVRGVMQLATFIPWQLAESDISHTQVLTRFLQACARRQLSVYLILSPEVGVHYPNSGLPKDIVLKKENIARHCDSGEVIVNLPPNVFYLPSFFASEFNKRYYSFVGRIDGVLADLEKSQPQVMRNVVAILSGSFWKYYRSPMASSHLPFGGNGGDYSSQANQTFRQSMEQFFSQKEFMDPTPSSANLWKMRSLEEVNRRWFYQQSEDVFRNRTYQTLRKRSSSLKVLEAEIFAPEADATSFYSNFLQIVSGGEADFFKLSTLLDEAAARASVGGHSVTFPWIHWTLMGGFRLLPEAEKQFLILKSLLLFGGQKGGIFLDESEWFSLSCSFRTRVEALILSLQEGLLQVKNRVLYLSSHLWSHSGTFWEELLKQVQPHIRMISSMDLLAQEKNATLLIVDPALILTQEKIQKLVAWAKAGRVVVMPRNPFYTELAKGELDRSLAKTKRIEVDMGLTYRLHALGEGRLVIYDALSSLSTQGEPLASWRTFVQAILSIAEVDRFCTASHDQLSIIPLEREGDSLAIFILNPCRMKLTVDLTFSSDVRVKDLGVILSRKKGAALSSSLVLPAEDQDQVCAKQFSIEIPPLGVLPLLVEGVYVSKNRDSQLAALSADDLRKSALEAASQELSGLNSEPGLGDLWN